MKIIELRAENFKKLRLVEVRPDGCMVQFTGKNGQGKSSVLDAFMFAIVGIKALPQDPVRKGAKTMLVSLTIGPSNAKEDLEFRVTRTLTAGSKQPSLEIVMIKGRRDLTPQQFLDRIFDAITFDPLEFIRMAPAEQIAKLRETAKVTTDDTYTTDRGETLTGFAAIDAANEKDYKERHDLNRDLKALQAQIDGMQTLAGLPTEKLNEEAILEKLNEAGEANRKAQELFRAKQDLGAAAAQLGVERTQKEAAIVSQEKAIEMLRKELARAEKHLESLERERIDIDKRRQEAERIYQAAPAGEPVDVNALTTELQSAQRTNRAIDALRQKEKLERERDRKAQIARELSIRMEARDERKRLAVAKAKMPVEGLTFNDSMTEVFYNGLPLENLGEGEQIRISALIGMEANPELRVLCIRHGEALDEDGLAVLAKLAEDHDFQIWMARVDTSGKVGLVLEDGMVVARNKSDG